MLKRSRAFYLVIIIGLFFLAGCTKDIGTVSADTSPLLRTTIIGGRTGGAWSVFTEGIAESIRRENSGSIITVEPGGIVENPASVGTNTVPYGLSYGMTAYAAYMGKEPYKEAYQDIRAISVVIPDNYYQLVGQEDIPYDSLKDAINDKAPLRLAVDQKGSAGEIITRAILQEYGVTYDDFLSWGGSVDYLSGSMTFELMADNRIDIAGDAVSVPSSDIIEAGALMDLKFLSLEQRVIESVAMNLGMNLSTIPKDSYEFLNKELNTISTPAILIVHKDVSDEEVYQVTKAIYESFDYLETVHKEFRNLSAENMSNVGKIPLHPGAEKFYKDQGLIE